MHILHVFPSFQLGGSQRRFAALANHFGARYRHTVISLDGQEDALQLVEPHVSLVMGPAHRKMGMLASMGHARRIIRDINPDVLVTYNWGAMEWAAANIFCGKRHIHIEDGFGPEEAHGQIYRRVLFRRLVLNVRSTLVLPSHTLKFIAQDIWRISAERIAFIPNGIPTARFASAQHNPSLKFYGHGPVIGTVATLRKEKALERLIQAFTIIRKRRSARLVIVGDGPEREALEEIARTAGVASCVTFPGSLSAPEKAVCGFNVFALSSDTEQMPLSILEAMSAGLPIAATDVGDVRRLVSDANQPYIVPKDAAKLAEAIESLLNEPALQQRIGEDNQTRAAREYDEQTMFARYDQLFSGQA